MSPGPAAFVLLACLTWIFHLPAISSLSHTTTSKPPSKPDISFYIHPRPSDADTPVIDDVDALIPSHPLIVVFHGFKGDHTARSMESIKQALLMSGESNVVVADWGPLADAPHETALGAYHHVRDHGVTAAADLAVQWLQQAMYHRDIAPEQVHLIGFSLGAHVVGVVGHRMNSSLGRLSGLDPPSFGYERMPDELCLDAADAQFVNVIHSSAGVLSYSVPIGHVDFFPNEVGMPQQGCQHKNPIDTITCTHYFAFALFAESIYNKDAFIGTECSDWEPFKHGTCDNNTKVAMGYATPNSTRGKFYGKTGAEPPFGKNDPNHPLPEKLTQLLRYTKNDSIVKPEDVINFLMRPEPVQRAAGDDPEKNLETIQENFLWDQQKKVMRVKMGRRSTTTPDPPPFLESMNSASGVNPSIDILATLTGSILLRIFSSKWF